MVFDGPSFTEQMNEETAELESLRVEVEELEKANMDLVKRVEKAEDARHEGGEAWAKLYTSIADALEDLSTLSEVPLNLVEAAIENIMDDLRKAL